MHPILFQLGPFTVYAYGALLALGAGLGLILLGRLARDNDLDAEKVTNLGLWVLVAGIAGSRLVFVLLEPQSFLARPYRVLFFWKGAWCFMAALPPPCLLAWWLTKRWGIPLLKLIDTFAAPLALGQAFGRLGCFMAGCCYGLPYDGACAVTFTDPHTLAPPGVPLHPTQLYSAVELFLLTGFLLLVWRRRRFDGQVFCLYGMVHGSMRVIIETFRGDFRGDPLLGPFTPTAVFALALAVACALGLIILGSRRKA